MHQLQAAVDKLKAGAGFLQGASGAKMLAAVKDQVQTALDMADSLGMVDGNSGLPALLQQPISEVPVADYTFQIGRAHV